MFLYPSVFPSAKKNHAMLLPPRLAALPHLSQQVLGQSHQSLSAAVLVFFARYRFDAPRFCAPSFIKRRRVLNFGSLVRLVLPLSYRCLVVSCVFMTCLLGLGSYFMVFLWRLGMFWSLKFESFPADLLNLHCLLAVFLFVIKGFLNSCCIKRTS